MGVSALAATPGKSGKKSLSDTSPPASSWLSSEAMWNTSGPEGAGPEGCESDGFVGVGSISAGGGASHLDLTFMSAKVCIHIIPHPHTWSVSVYQYVVSLLLTYNYHICDSSPKKTTLRFQHCLPKLWNQEPFRLPRLHLRCWAWHHWLNHSAGLKLLAVMPCASHHLSRRFSQVILTTVALKHCLGWLVVANLPKPTGLAQKDTKRSYWRICAVAVAFLYLGYYMWTWYMLVQIYKSNMLICDMPWYITCIVSCQTNQHGFEACWHVSIVFSWWSPSTCFKMWLEVTPAWLKDLPREAGRAQKSTPAAMHSPSQVAQIHQTTKANEAARQGTCGRGAISGTHGPGTASQAACHPTT